MLAEAGKAVGKSAADRNDTHPYSEIDAVSFVRPVLYRLDYKPSQPPVGILPYLRSVELNTGYNRPRAEQWIALLKKIIVKNLISRSIFQNYSWSIITSELDLLKTSIKCKSIEIGKGQKYHF